MNIYDFKVEDSKGELVSLENYRGKVVLIINTATKCGLTPQYESLQKLYKKFNNKGFEILDFPCNQFLEQSPGTAEEINEFCSLNFGTKFTRFTKIDVNGENESPLYTWLKNEKSVDKGNYETIKFEEMVKQYTPDIKDGDVKWNFGKFLINRNGDVVERYSPAMPPEALETDIEKLLK